jgi:hypothetical protein
MISIVVPVHNEEQSLSDLHGELDAVFAGSALGPAEFIFVDDGSRDGSWNVLAGLCLRDPRVKAIRFRRNFGKAAALVAAFQGANLFSHSMETFKTIPRRFPGSWPSSKKAMTSSAAGRRPVTTPGTRFIPAGSSTGWSAA